MNIINVQAIFNSIQKYLNTYLTNKILFAIHYKLTS